MSTAQPLYRLSKSKIAAFEHCPRRLWLQVHRRWAGEYEPETLERFAIGHAVGARATREFPDGIMVEAVPDIRTAVERTSALLGAPVDRPIFEATFLHQDVLVRVDILQPTGTNAWRAIEVKASRRVKQYQLADIATQVWVMRGQGVHVSQAIIRHLATPLNWRRPDLGRVTFADTDVTASIGRKLAARPAVAKAALAAIQGLEVKRDMGTHCTRPFPCEFHRHCAGAAGKPLLAAMLTGSDPTSPSPHRAID